MSAKVNPNAPIVRKDLDDAVSAILEGMDNMFKDPDNPMNKRLDGVEYRLSELETKVDNHYKWLKDDISGLKADLSDTVSRKEFNQLKSRVNKYHQAN